MKNENVELNNKVSELQSISDKYDESVCEFELKEQKIKTAEAQLGAAFLDARKYSDEIVSAANVKPLIFRQRLRLKYRNKLLR